MSSPERTARARTPEEIEARLAAQRADLAASVDALADRVSPSAQVREAAQEVKTNARELGQSLRDLGSDLREHATRTVSQACEGEPEALKALAVAGGALVAAAAVGITIARRGAR
nr:DUF3618 domain-containing protein [Actinomyces sp.]